MTYEEILHATRDELVAYLEAWGFACYDSDHTQELRTAALENLATEEGE